MEVVPLTENITTAPAIRLHDALRASDASARLQAALTAGTHPNDAYLPVLIDRCAVEPDFYVRDMLTWAITRHRRALAVDLLLCELVSTIPQARSQALHSLSKIGDARAWSAITRELLRDDDDEVAKAAWRTAAGLVPEGERSALAYELGRNLGRGDRDLRRSLSHAIAMLGHTAEPVIEAGAASADDDIRVHALATAHVMANPDDGFDAAVDEARRVVARDAAPASGNG